MKTRGYANFLKFLRVWGGVSIVCVLLYLLAIYTNVGRTFFAIVSVANILALVVATLLRQTIALKIDWLLRDFAAVTAQPMPGAVETQWAGQSVARLILLAVVIIVGSYLAVLSVNNVPRYAALIKEDGIVEYSSALCWLFSALIMVSKLGRQYRLYAGFDRHMVPDALLLLLFVLCCGEEISWGQRLFALRTPDLLSKINVQHETNLHNIGSTSIFSNLFFLGTLVFFLGVPYIAKKYQAMASYLHHYAYPLPHRFAIAIFCVTLAVWLFVGMRFGTLGFHPFSVYPQHYYTQMDDEIFELLAAYSFLAFSLLDELKTPR